MRAPFLALAVLLVADVAAADDDVPTSWKLGGGLELYYHDDAMRVRKGRRSAPIPGRPRPGAEVVVGKDRVTITHMPFCEDVTLDLTHAQLEAQLDLVEGQALLKRGKVADAAARFAHAVALDPALDQAARLQTIALVRLRRHDDAIAALASRLAADPVRVLVDVRTDPALQPLATHATLTALHAATPGTAQIDATTLALPAPGLFRAPDGSLATIEAEGYHGACSSTTDLAIRDGKSLRVRARVLLGNPRDYRGDGCSERASWTPRGRRAIAARVAVANQLLRDLGFAAPVAFERATIVKDEARSVFKLQFAAAKLGVVVDAGGATRVFKDRKLLAEHRTPPIDGMQPNVSWALLLPGDRIVFETFHFGCEWSEHTNLVSVPAP